MASRCGGACGCGGMATDGTTSFTPSLSVAAPTATIAVGEPVPMTACKCGRSPWWWLLVAFVVGYSMKRGGK